MTSLRDKADLARGLSKKNTSAKQITTYQHTIQIDTRDCVGKDSLNQSRQAFYSEGGRGPATGIVSQTTGIGISPITIYTNITSTLKNGDVVRITDVQGNTIVNNDWKINNIVNNVSFDINSVGNGNFAGSGIWLRSADNGFPNIGQNTSTVLGNEMNIIMGKKLKAIKSISLNLSIIPRDIIPINSYYKDIYNESLGGDTTFIPIELSFITENLFGFYSTPLSMFRNYKGLFAIPNQVTPPPLNLWNPQLGNWPLQPLSYVHQTVPTYRSGTVTMNGTVCHLVCSGYGIYDLKDWTALTRTDTEKARKSLLKVIIRMQTYKNIDYLSIIDNIETTSNNISPYGYGKFQRFVCGPGTQLNYQPGTSDSANPSIASGEWPIAFPNFLGNVWGPYDSPGDRFQKLGVRDTIQDLFLNGDLDNINGEPIIKKDIKVSEIMNDVDYGLNTKNFIKVDMSNFGMSTNPNILNASRIVQNGFGASNVIATGSGGKYTVGYQSAGGIGPSNIGAPGSWSTSGVYGAPSITDPNAVGPLSYNLLTNGTVPQTTVSNLPTDNSGLTHRVSWYDMGPNNGMFIKNMSNYRKYAVTNLPETNLVVQAFQFPRTVFSQSTNTDVGTSIFNVPVRLSPGFSDGNFDYEEGLYGLLTQSSPFDYWGQQFLSPLSSLDKITLSFFTYEGLKIPLEKMLSYKNTELNLNSRLRSKKFISMILRAECYHYVNVGLVNCVENILGNGDNEESEEKNNFNVKASNFDDYS